MKRILLVSLILTAMLLIACETSAPLVTNPSEVEQYVKAGMDIDDVVDLIDPVYGNEAVYSVNCEYLSTGENIAFVPALESPNFTVWFFMSQEGWEESIAVGFKYDSQKNTYVVNVVGQFEYDRIEPVIEDYGKKVVWGKQPESNETTNGDTIVTLIMSISGSGNVTPAAGSYTYPLGKTVYITATPASGWQFSNWTGNVTDTGSAIMNVTMNENQAVTANFRQIPTPTPEGNTGVSDHT